MVYFWCCEVTNSEGIKKKVNGYVETGRKIREAFELKEVQSEVMRGLQPALHQAEPNMNWNDANIVFLAFNPL